MRSEEHTSELQSLTNLVCRLLLECFADHQELHSFPTRRSSDLNSYIANGIDMKAGDEVLMTDQEHPGGEHPWNLRAKRYGVVVKKVTLPKPVQNAAQVLNQFNEIGRAHV